jgi:hypothetical protein
MIKFMFKLITFPIRILFLTFCFLLLHNKY